MSGFHSYDTCGLKRLTYGIIHIAKEVAYHKHIMTTQIYGNPLAEKIKQVFTDIRVLEILPGHN